MNDDEEDDDDGDDDDDRMMMTVLVLTITSRKARFAFLSFVLIEKEMRKRTGPLRRRTNLGER